MPADADTRHSHVFDLRNPVAERRTRQVLWLTVAMMLVEIVAGTVFGSMALLADGWHMSSHALALGVSVGAYALSRRFAHDPRFAFGTWKIEVLGGYTSAVLLLGVAAYMGIESVARLVQPQPIRFDEAIPVAVLGLAVNVACAWLLSTGQGGHQALGHDDHGRGHGHHDHGPGHAHGAASRHAAGHADGAAGRDAHPRHQDLNLRAAYLHVVADAVTSLLAIAALVGGRYFGAPWLDPLMGLAGAALVTRWAWGLIHDTGRVLLDAEMDAPVVAEVREVVGELPGPTTLRDLHVWRVGTGKYACIVSLATGADLTADQVRGRLAIHEELVHVTVEISR